MKIGSLFSGYLGLDMAVEQVFGAETVWCSDIDPGASKILAHRTTAPNLGDITKINWGAVKPVDIITGGFPCQDLSHAGKRAGMNSTTRSGLWSHMAEAVNQLRPRYVVAENVRGLLSADAHSDLEPCPWCLGDSPDRQSVLRALGCVLGDLADIGYDTQWVGLRAADVGAPHGRFRIFVLASDTEGGRRRPSRHQDNQAGSDDAPLGSTHQPAADAGGVPGKSRRIATPGQTEGGRALGQLAGRDRARAAGDTDIPRLEGRGICGGGGDERSAGPAGLGSVADAGSERHGRGEDARRLGRMDGEDAGETWERERPREVARDRSATTTADAASEPWSVRDGNDVLAWGGTVRREPAARGSVTWGVYEPAVRRWESVLGRPAPAPTEASPKGSQRLSPAFVEFMMGVPPGWVTDVPGLNRNAQLKALGNGVVPQQAAAALKIMLAQQQAVAA